MGYQKKLYDVPKINSVQQMILKTAEKYGDKLALEDLNPTPIGRVTYSELLESILKFGASLQKLGYKERAHIAVIGENRVQWAISYLTCMTFNYVVVPIDKNLTDNEILNIIHESDSEAVIYSSSFENLFTGIRHSLKKVKHLICMDEASGDKGFHSMISMIRDSEPVSITDLPEINPEDMAEIIFTSGSLGRAKGVMLSQRNLASNLVDMVSMLMMYPEDRFLSVLPMHHTYECTCGMLCPLYSGSSVHYARSLKTVVEDFQRAHPTILLGVPLLYDKMFKKIVKSINDDKVKSVIVPPLKKLTNFLGSIGIRDIKKKIFKELHERFGGNVRIFIAGGAAPDPEVAKGLREFGFNFLQGYGLTETSPILTLNRLDNFKDEAAGLPLPSVEIKIVNPDESGSGEIYTSGPNIMLGYYKNPELTEEIIVDGWFKTGDIGYIDEDGFLHINGRKKNVIISKSGKNVFPEEIEDALNKSPFILESIVYGAEDEKQDEIIAALIVVDAEALIQYAEEKNLTINDDMMNTIIDQEIKGINKALPSYKRVVKFTIRDKEFEKTTTQKIKRYLINNGD
ncbi:MAG: AMP-binding protein [Melioribacteraceae bacterium]|nr:AMP-binding protein [Melioribacteraceae bacterium]